MVTSLAHSHRIGAVHKLVDRGTHKAETIVWSVKNITLLSSTRRMMSLSTVFSVFQNIIDKHINAVPYKRTGRRRFWPSSVLNVESNKCAGNMKAHTAIAEKTVARKMCHILRPGGSLTYNWSLWPRIWLNFDLWTSPSSVSPTPSNFLVLSRLCKSPLLCFPSFSSVSFRKNKQLSSDIMYPNKSSQYGKFYDCKVQNLSYTI